jgi:hypothetical protein
LPLAPWRRDLPAPQQHSVAGTPVEFLALRVREGKGSIGLADEIGRQFASQGMNKISTVRMSRRRRFASKNKYA